MSDTPPKDWRIDKHVPVALIFAGVIQILAFIWYAAKVDAIVQQVPAIDHRVNQIEVSRFTNDDAARWHRTIVAEIKAEISPMIAKIDRNSTDIRRNTDTIRSIQPIFSK